MGYTSLYMCERSLRKSLCGNTYPSSRNVTAPDTEQSHICGLMHTHSQTHKSSDLPGDTHLKPSSFYLERICFFLLTMIDLFSPFFPKAYYPQLVYHRRTISDRKQWAGSYKLPIFSNPHPPSCPSPLGRPLQTARLHRQNLPPSRKVGLTALILPLHTSDFKEHGWRSLGVKVGGKICFKSQRKQEHDLRREMLYISCLLSI